MKKLSCVIPTNSRIVSRYHEIVIQAPGGAYWRLSEMDDRGCGGRVRRQVERVPRESIPDITWRDPIDPVMVQIDRDEGAAVITRYWTPGAVEACDFCPVCIARSSVSRPGLKVCILVAPAEVTDEDAAQHVSDWIDVLP